MRNSLNVISFFHASTLQEEARAPIVIPTMHGIQKTPCAMDIVDRFEQAEALLGDRFEATVSASGPSRRGEFKVAADQNPEEIDSPEIPKEGYGPHTPESMAQHIAEHWKSDAYNVVHVRAHGHAHEDVMGMPTQHFLSGLKMASDKVGRPLDTVLMESCLMSSLGVMSQLNGSVSTIIASQEVLNAKALPHKEMLAGALEGDLEPRPVAARMMEAAREHGTADTLVALDPSKLGDVVEAVVSLKQGVDKSVASDRSLKKLARKAVKSSPRFPRRQVETGYRRKLDLRDLGELADSFSSSEFGTEVAAKSRRVKSALNEAVIDGAFGPGYVGVSGVSVQSGSVMEKTGFDFFGLMA